MKSGRTSDDKENTGARKLYGEIKHLVNELMNGVIERKENSGTASSPLLNELVFGSSGLLWGPFLLRCSRACL